MRVIVGDGVLTRELNNPRLVWDDLGNALTIFSDTGTEHFVNFKVADLSMAGIILSAQTALNSGNGRGPEPRIIALLVDA